jgi:hypothetical protein
MEASSGLRAVKILAGGGRTYWLELRQATGFDAGLSGTVLSGALVRLAPSSVGGTDLLDMTPPSNMGDAALAVPNTFTDAASGLTVTSVSKAGSLLTVDVSLLAPRRLYTLTPCRLADTRNTAGPWGGPYMSAGQARTFTAWYRCGVPSTARALAMNVSVTAPGAPGYLSLCAAGSTAQPTSALNFSAFQTRTNNAHVSLGGSGDLTVLLGSAGAAHVILDVVGYWE